MIRNVLVVAAAIVLSGLLAAAMGLAIAGDPDARLIREHFAKQNVSDQRADALWAALERADFRITWLYCPAVLVVVGTFVGLLSPRLAWQLALIATAPFAIMFSIAVAGLPSGLPLLGIYLALAALSAWSAALLVRRVRT